MMRWCCILLLMVAGRAMAADVALVGRLFYTPEQRAALEDARRKNIRAEEQAAEASKRPRAAAPSTVTVSGVMRRSDGESVIWINGKPVDSETDDGMRVRLAPDQAGVTVHDPTKGRTVRLKVGQHADLLTGKVEENYARRQAPPAPAGDEATVDKAASEGKAASPQSEAQATAHAARGARRSQREQDKERDASDPPPAEQQQR
jgi:hypothetical protein